MESDAGAFEEGGDFGEGLDGADFVVGVLHADQGEVVAEQSLQVAEVDNAVSVDAEVIDAGAAVAAEIFGGAQDGLMLDAGFRQGESPSGRPNADSTFRDARGHLCTVKNREIFDSFKKHLGTVEKVMGGLRQRL